MKFTKSTVALLSLVNILPFLVKAQTLTNTCDYFTYQGPDNGLNPTTGAPEPTTDIHGWVSTTGVTLYTFCQNNNCCSDTTTGGKGVIHLNTYNNPNSQQVWYNCGYWWNPNATYKICDNTCNWDATAYPNHPPCTSIARNGYKFTSPLVEIESGSCNGLESCYYLGRGLNDLCYIKLWKNSCVGWYACWHIGGVLGDPTNVPSSVETIEVGENSCHGMNACNQIGYTSAAPSAWPFALLKSIKIDNNSCQRCSNGSCQGSMPPACIGVGHHTIQGNVAIGEAIEIGCNVCNDTPNCSNYTFANTLDSTLFGSLCTPYFPKPASCYPPAPPDPCTNKNCNDAGKCTVVDGSPHCICENTFENTVNGDGCVCPVGTTLDIPNNRCLAPPTIAPTSIEPTRSPVAVKTSKPTSVTSLPTPSSVFFLNDDCEDSTDFEFMLEMSEKFVSCEWLTQNKKRSDARTEKYCAQADVQGACQSSCANCQCGDDQDFTFTTTNTKEVVDCSYITKNWKKAIARRNKLCFTDNDCRKASTIGSACAAACGFCDATSTSTCTRSNAPTSFPTQTLTKSPIASPPVPVPSKGYDTPSKGSNPPAPVPVPSKGYDIPSKGYDTPSKGNDSPSKGIN